MEEFVEVASVEGIKNGSVIKFEEGEIIIIVSAVTNTVERLLNYTPNKELSTFNLSIEDKFCGPYRGIVIRFSLLNRTISL